MNQPHHTRLNRLQNVFFDMSLNKELRPVQVQALDWVKQPLLAGKKFLVVEMPTGSGKSIFSQYFIDYYLKNINAKASVDILTNSKILQQQYVKDFDYINNLNGRGSYSCSQWETSCDHGQGINKGKGTTCEGCPYLEAKERFMLGRVGVTNFHVAALNRIHNPLFSEQRKSDLLVVDEAHLLEETINGFLSVTIGPRLWNKHVDFSHQSIDRRNYEEGIYRCQTITDVIAWVEKRFLPDLNASKKKLSGSKEIFKILESINKIKALDEIITRLEKVVSNYHSKPGNFILDRKLESNEMVFSIQPLWSGELVNKYLFDNYKHVLLMSATFISEEVIYHANGIAPNRAGYLSLPSTFPVANHPVYYYPLGKMSFNNKETTWKEYVPVIKKILAKYKGKKGIIHAGTYEMLQWLQRDVRDPRLVFALSDNREAALRHHCESPDDTVLVSPSMTEGVDLVDDASRFQVVMKVPYPSLQSAVNKQRLKENPKWYAMKTVQTIVQSIGRSVRSKTDYADTFILDSCFGDVLRQSSEMIPPHIKQSIQYIKSKPA